MPLSLPTHSLIGRIFNHSNLTYHLLARTLSFRDFNIYASSFLDLCLTFYCLLRQCLTNSLLLYYSIQPSHLYRLRLIA